MLNILPFLWSKSRFQYVVIYFMRHYKKSDTNSHKPLFKKIPLYAAIVGVNTMLNPALIFAGPDGGNVVDGSGSIHHSGSTTTILQNSDRIAINWQSFNVAADERVRYIQPDSQSISLNTVLSNHGSQINGQIDANGHVFLVNPNGVVFGGGAQINVGGLLASGLAIDPSAFMNGDFAFASVDNTQGIVINSGTLNAATGGSIALLGKQVENNGFIKADLGRVTLASGERAIVSFDGGLLGVRVSEALLKEALGDDTGVLNSGEIYVQGGQILLTGAASHDIFTQSVNYGDTREAQSVVIDEDGSFTLSASGVDVVNTGVLDASSQQDNQTGGQIVVLGENVTSSGQITVDSKVSTGAQSGRIELHSIETTELIEGSATTANSANGTAGDIYLLGRNVGVLDDAIVEVSGVYGGGELLVGGDQRGSNALIRNAEFIFVGGDTRLSADGIENGDGGKVITFASDTARIYGDLTARGGSVGGYGGFIETSGLLGFDIGTIPNTNAPVHGGGEWLIDPFNITIVDGSGVGDVTASDSSNTRTYTPNMSGAQIGWHVIEGYIDGDSDSESGRTVRIETTSSGSDDGDIIFDLANGGASPINAVIDDDESEALTNSRLILDADGDIEFRNQSLSVARTEDLLHLDLIADGDIRFTGSSTIDLGGGEFTASSTNFNLGEQGTTNTSFNTGGGFATLTVSGEVNIYDSFSTNGGDFTVGTSDSRSSSFNSYFAAGGGLAEDRGTINTRSNLADGDIEIFTSGNVTLGNITVGDADFDTGSNRGTISTTLIDSTDNITLNGTYDYTTFSSFNTALSLVADGSVTIGDLGIIDNSSEDNDLTLVLTADRDLNGSGDIAIAGNTPVTNNLDTNIYTGGGSFIASGVNFSVGNASANSVGQINTQGGNVSITAAGDINLYSNQSQFSDEGTHAIISEGGTVSISGNNFTGNGDSISAANTVEITSSNAATLGSISVTGNNTLTVNANGTISNGTGSLSVTGLATFDANLANDATVGDITLDNTNNDFDNGIYIVEGNNVTIVDQDNVELAGASTSLVGGTFSVTALNNGIITDSNNLQISGAATFNAEANTITLNNSNDFRSSVHLTGANVTINDAFGSLILGDNSSASQITGSLDADTVGSISQSGPLVVGGNTSLTVGSGQSIDVSNSGNSFTGSVAFDASSGSLQNVSIYDNTALSLQDDLSTTEDLTVTAAGLIFFDTTVGGNLTATAIGSGTIVDELNNSFTISGDANFTALGNTIDLSNENNVFDGIVTVDTHGENPGDSGGNIIVNATSITLSDVSSFGADNDAGVGGDAGTILIQRADIVTTGVFDASGGLGDVSANNGDSQAIELNSVNNGLEYTFNSGTSWTGASFTVNGWNNVDTFNINTDLGDATINGGNDVDTFNIAASVGTINGGNGNDIFNLQATGVTSTLNGNGNTNTLNITHASGSTWALNSSSLQVTDTSLAPGTVTFMDMANLVGNNQADTFTVNTAFSDNFDAQEGQNIFNLNANVTGNITGGDERDEINVLVADVNLSNGVQAGDGDDEFNLAFDITGGTLQGQDGDDVFNIQTGTVTATLDGGGTGANVDSVVIAHSENSTWIINGGNETVQAFTASDNTPLDSITFSNVEQVDGGSGRDTFIVSSDDVGELNGLDGDDIFQIEGFNLSLTIDAGDGANDVVDYSGLSGNSAVTVNLQTGANLIQNAEVYVGNSDAALSRGSSAFDDWQVALINVDLGSGNIADGVNDGTVSNGTTTLSFINFGHLIGGNTRDQFTLTDGASFTGTIDGGVGSANTLTQNTANQTWTLGESGAFTGTVNTTNFENISLIMGSETDTLEGRNEDTTWTLIGVTGNTVAPTSSTSEAIAFAGISQIDGGDNIDRFAVNGDFGGNIDAGNGNDLFTLNASYTGTYDGAADNDNVVIASALASGIVQGGTGENTISSQVATGSNTWAITNENDGSVTNTSVVNFENFENITSGEGADVFTFGTAGRVTGTIDGGAGAGANTIVGRNTDNQWTITDANNGRVRDTSIDDLYINAFSNVQNLTGTDRNDAFILASGNGVTGTITGGDGSGIDEIDYSELDTVIVDLNGGLNGVLGVETLVGNDDDSTLIGENITGATQVWSITDANEGSVGDINFRDFNNLTGGSGDDQFIFTEVGASVGGITGRLSGGGHETSTGDQADYSALTTAQDLSFNSTNGNITDVENIIGNSGTLTGDDAATTWTIDTNNGGQLNDGSNDTRFSDFNALEGGDRDDTFIFSSESVSIAGGINAGGHELHDTVDLKAFTAVDVTLGAVIQGVDNAERIVGQGNDSRLNVASLATTNTWVINNENDGTVAGYTFVDFAQLVGGPGDDNFTVSAGGSITGTIDGGNQSSEDTLVYAGAVDITLDQDILNIEDISAASASTLRVFNASLVGNNDWQIDGTNSGSLNGVTFSGFANLFGSDRDDTFTFFTNGVISGTINAGGQQSRDTVDLSNRDSVAITLGGNVEGVAGAERIVGNSTDSTLTGTDAGLTWEITEINTGEVAGIIFEDFNNLIGGSGDDVFEVQASGEIEGRIDGGSHAVDGGDSVTYLNASVLRVELENDLANIENVTGNGANSTLVGADTGHNWTINGTNSGQVSGMNFNQFATLVGGQGVDTFSVVGGTIDQVQGGNGANSDVVVGDNFLNIWDIAGLASGSVDGITSFVEIETLRGNELSDTFNVGNEFGGTIEGEGGDDIFNVSANVGNTLLGGEGLDDFRIQNAGLTVTVDGEQDNASVTVLHTDNVTWEINGGTSERASDTQGGVLIFGNVDTVQGGSGVDTFELSSDSVSTFLGGNGSDVYQVLDSSDLTFTLDGQDGSDRIEAANRDNIWSVIPQDDESTLNTLVSFFRMENLIGNGGDDKFNLGINATSTFVEGNGGENTLIVASAPASNIDWFLNDEGQGSVSTIVNSFVGIHNVIGGEGSDHFGFVSTAAHVSGLIDGGTSSDVGQTARDTLDVSVFADGVIIELGTDTTSNNLHVTRVESIAAAEDMNLGDVIDTESANQLVSQSTEGLSWTIDQRNAGRVDPTAGAAPETQVEFAHIGNIIGADGSDIFLLTGDGEISGVIEGGDGDGIDVLDLSASLEDLSFNIGGVVDVGTEISGFEGLIGNNDGLTEGAPRAELRVASGTNTWTFANSSNDFTDGINDGTFDDGSGGTPEFYFVNFNSIVGGNGQDTFLFEGNTSVTGSLNGGDNPALNPDILDSRGLTNDLVVQLDGDDDGILNLSQIERILANDTLGRNNTLRASEQSSQDNTWAINGTNAGLLNDTISYSGFSSLVGGEGTDRFELNNNDAVSGLINGAGGNDVLAIDVLSNGRNVSVAIGNKVTADDFNVVSIETINGNANNANTLIADDVDNTWVVTGTNGGQVVGGIETVSFTGFENITGGNQNDRFVFDGDDTITGLIDGGVDPTVGSATDTLDIIGLNDDIIVTLVTGSEAGLSVRNIELVNANAGNNNTLVAEDVHNTFLIDADDGGTLNDDLAFTAFGNLTGGDLVDEFIFSESGSLSGRIDGGAQLPESQDVVDMRLLDAVSVSIGGDAGDFQNIEYYIGNNTDSLLAADDQVNAWVFVGEANSGKLNDKISFEGFNLIHGGAGRDIFTFNGGSLTGDIFAGDGNDELVVDIGNDQSGEVRFIGDEGSDSVSIAGGSLNYSADYNIDNSGARLSYSNTENANAYEVAFDEIESVNDNVVADTLTINNISDQADTVALSNNQFAVNELAVVDYTNKESLTVDGEGIDTVRIDSAIAINNQFEVQRAAVVMGENGGRIRAQTTHFIDNMQIGDVNNALLLRTNNILLDSVEGPATIDEFDQVTLVELNRPSDFVNIRAGGDVSANDVLISANSVRLVSDGGDINLAENTHQFTGVLDLISANGDVLLDNNATVQLGEVSTRNLSIASNGEILASVDSDIRATEVATLSAMRDGNAADIVLNQGTVNIARVEVGQANNIQLVNTSSLDVIGLLADGDVTLQANGLDVSGALVGQAVDLSAGTGTAQLLSTIDAGSSLTISGNTITQNRDGLIESQNTVSLNANGQFIQRAGINAISGDIHFNLGQSLVMESGSSTTASVGNVHVNAGEDISITSLSAISGDVVLNAGGSVLDVNENAVNITASRFEAHAGTGVGSNGRLDLAVDRVMADSNGGSIRLGNDRETTVEHVRTNGDIELYVSSGSMFLDNTLDENFDPTNPDANIPGAVINAGYNQGSVNITLDSGDLFALGTLNSSQPDLVAKEALVFNLPTGEIGSSSRPLVIYVRDRLVLTGFRSWNPVWSFNERPEDYQNTSTIQADIEQLLQSAAALIIEVEELTDISPAIFTDVRNFTIGPNDIRLPQDQLYDLDEES